LLAITVWSVHHATTLPAPRWRGTLVTVLLVLGVALLRPEGWLVPPLVAGYVGSGAMSRVARRAMALALAAIAVAGSVVLVPHLPGRSEGVLGAESFLNGRTIWGSDRWTVAMPQDPDLILNRRGLSGVARYAAAHPAKLSGLVLARVAVHVANVR